MTVTRDDLIGALRKATEPRDDVDALYLGGSDGFGRTDDYSDIDAVVLVAPGAGETVLDAVEAGLETLGAIAHRWDVGTSFHGCPQRFLRVAGAGEWLDIDIVAIDPDAPERFDEPERHGEPLVVFDKSGAVRPGTIDRDALRARLTERIDAIGAALPFLAGSVQKYVARDDPVAAAAAYRAYLLNPLVEALRIRHDPYRHDYGAHYLRDDLPPDTYDRLSALVLPAGVEDLPAKATAARRFLEETLAALATEPPVV